MSDFDETLNEEELNIITLTDEDGTDKDFEFLDLIDLDDKEYVVLLPCRLKPFCLIILPNVTAAVPSTVTADFSQPYVSRLLIKRGLFFLTPKYLYLPRALNMRCL